MWVRNFPYPSLPFLFPPSFFSPLPIFRPFVHSYLLLRLWIRGLRSTAFYLPSASPDIGWPWNVIWCILSQTRNTFCETWYRLYNQVYNDRTIRIIMAGCISPARNGHISTFGLKSDVTIVFFDPDFFKDTKISAICVHFRQIQGDLIFAWISNTSWPKMGNFEGWQNRGRGGAILTPSKFVFTFGDSNVCANFGLNRSRECPRTDTLTHW